MVSLLITREFGFTLNLTKNEIGKVLVVVSSKRNKTCFLSTKAAMELRIAAEKALKLKVHCYPILFAGTLSMAK